MRYFADNAYYNRVATQELAKASKEPKTHVIQMVNDEGELVTLTKPNSERVTKNTLVRFKRFMPNAQMARVKK
jgi:hypothetical protein